MGIPAKPRVQHQGPATHCVINGKALGWLSCTAYSTAMGIDKATLGRKRPSGCDVRHNTGDTVGGLTLPQVGHVCESEYNVSVDVNVGGDFATPSNMAFQLRKGRGMVLQGYTGVLLNTRFRSTGGGVNHAVYVNDVRGGTATAPREARVYDPAADGRRAGIDSSPSWWPWSLVKSFASHLHPYGEGDSRLLGSGRMYTMVFQDTEPHNHPHYGGQRTTPFPDRTRTYAPSGHRVNVRSRPDRLVDSDIKSRLVSGTLFVAYQKAHGIKPPGSSSDLWYGNHDGNRWIHVSGLRSIGGTS